MTILAGNPRRCIGNILGSWIRRNVYTRRDGKKVYGYIYDAGSDGGAGMNRFGRDRIESPVTASCARAPVTPECHLGDGGPGWLSQC